MCEFERKDKFYFSCIWFHAFETDYIAAGEKKLY